MSGQGTLACVVCELECSVPSDLAEHIFADHDGDADALRALAERFAPTDTPNEAPRLFLSAEVETAARLVHPVVWGGRYRRGASPMNWASGPAHRRALLKKADRWEALAAAARVCADALPFEADEARS